LDGNPAIPLADPIMQVSPGKQSRLPQHVGVPWFAENIESPTWLGFAILLLLLASYMSK
jgi:hypothetical protein